MPNDLKTITAGGNTTIKTDGKDYILFVDGNEVDRNENYNQVAKLATDIYISRTASNDNMVGKRMFAPTEYGPSGLVVVVAKTEHGYLVQRLGSTQRFEILSDCLSEAPVELFK